MPPKLFDDDEWKKIVLKLGLSQRQSEIAALVLQGMSDKAISTQINMKKPTLRTHLRLMFQALGVDSRLGLAIYIFAASRELLTPKGFIQNDDDKNDEGVDRSN